MDQPDLFPRPKPLEGPLPPVKSADTRREGRAAGAVHAASLRGRMLAAYRERDWTDQELADDLRIDRTTVNARRNELIGVVEKGTRKNTRSGVNNVVWGLK